MAALDPDILYKWEEKISLVPSVDCSSTAVEVIEISVSPVGSTPYRYTNDTLKGLDLLNILLE